MAQTPLLGDENTPLHTITGGGTGFEGATPRRQVPFTPNPLATPYKGGATNASATPRIASETGLTPTPLRDSLSINPADGFSTVGHTPRDQRLRDPAKSALKASFMNLPKPENNFELLVPEDEEDATDLETGEGLSEEDAAERDARLRRIEEEERRKALARRSRVLQLGLPRPANIDLDTLIRDLNSDREAGPSDIAWRLISDEIVQLLQHDIITYPIPGTLIPGGTTSLYEIPPDDAIAAAQAEIQLELADSVGFPNANMEQTREVLGVMIKLDPESDQSASWAGIRQNLAFDSSSKTWLSPRLLPLEKRAAGYVALLDENRETMTREAGKMSKLEKKLGVTLGGYQARSKAFSKRISDAFDELQKGKVDYESFARLRINESVVGPRRVDALKEEVERLERREKRLQERYAELDFERKESERRIGVLEDKIMSEAEELNDAAMAGVDT
jgi:pre-mRNA-splicing factor CDC5/CEF1